MISWTITATGEILTGYSSNHESSTYSLSRTFTETSSQDGLLGGASSTSSFTSSESASEVRFRATITSGDQTATFRTFSTRFQAIQRIETGATSTFEYPGASSTANTVVVVTGEPTINSGSLEITTQTSSGLRTYFTVSAQTSTLETTSSTAFSTLNSSSEPPGGAAVAIRSSGKVEATTITIGEQTQLASTITGLTVWYFNSVTTQITQQTTTTIDQTVSGISRETIYQADANEILYKIAATDAPTFAANPVAARPLAVTATRITVSPVRVTQTRGATAVTNATDATSTETYPLITQETTLISRYGPDGQSSVETATFSVTTTGTSVYSIDYTATSTTSDSVEDDAPFTGGQTFATAFSTVVSENRFAPVPWLPRINSNGTQTERTRYGKAAWVVGGQTGSATTADLSFDFNYVTASSARGQSVFINATNSSYTLNAPSITYTTNAGDAATTSSSVIGVVGAPQLIVDGDPGWPEHFGGGPFADSWTVVDRLSENAAWRNLIDGSTSSFVGHDTSYSQGESTTPSHFTYEPHLLGDGPGATQNGRDAIYWTEIRNSPLPA